MIKARATIAGFDTLILGLSAENIRRLQSDEPIMFAGEPYGVAMNIMIMAGRDEGDIARKLGVTSSADPRVKTDPNPT